MWCLCGVCVCVWACRYLPNPRHVSPRAIAMFELVGKIMGCSLRLKMCLPFHLPLMVGPGGWGGVEGHPWGLAWLVGY